MLSISLCPSPELYPLYHREGASIIITDIFRASTTMVTAIANGAEAILPVASVEECERLGKAGGYLMAAERSVRRCAFADLGNDPLEYTPEVVSGKRIVMTTTNGTRSLSIAREAGARHILIGSLRNLEATLRYLHKQSIRQVVVLAAGWQGQASMEDCLYAGALAYEAERLSQGKALGDMALMLRDLWQAHCLNANERLEYIKRSEHYTRLEVAGFASTAPYCLELHAEDLVLGSTPETSLDWLVRLA